MTATITRTEQITDGLDSITWTITDEGGIASELIAHTSGLILSIETRSDRQGEGLARSLYAHADAEHGLYHVPAWGRTPEGDAFAIAMGGETMDDETAAAIVGMDLSIYDAA